MPPSDDEKFSHRDGERYLFIVPWKNKRKEEEGETKKIAGRRWFEPTLQFEPEIADTQMDTQTQLEVTQKEDTTKGEDLIEKRCNKTSSFVSPVKKKLKKEAPKIVGGMQGPSKGTRILDCGGNGDCAWRAGGFVLACHNAKWPADTSEIRGKTQTIGAALRASCVSWLLNVNHDWEESFAVDPNWTVQMEGGPAPKNLEGYKEALKRPKRWIDHMGLMAIAETKNVHLIIWQLNEEGWKRCAIIHASTASSTKKYPIVPLVLSPTPLNFYIHWRSSIRV